MTEGTRTLTEAEKALTGLVLGGVEFTIADKAIHNWVAEIASDVRALAATVESLSNQVGEHYDVFLARFNKLSDRLGALESPGSAEAAPEPVCQRADCGCPKSDHFQGDGSCTADDCFCHKFVPAEQAVQEPVCTVCGHEKCHHIGFGAFCAANHCACGGYYTVPAEQAVQEPPALDPVLVKSINELCDLVDWLAHGTVHMIGTGMCGDIFAKTAAIRAYGGDAREGGK